MKESNGSIIVGIDLGTSTTEAALIREGKPCMVPVQDGTFIIRESCLQGRRRVPGI